MFKRLTFYVYVAFMCIVFQMHAQREAANWYFGLNSGLTFNSGMPEQLINGALNTLEGCATISNADGVLLFYTDGVNVWDNTHEKMPNGENLFGSFSSTQSAIIIPNPANTNIYYIFTTDAVQNYQVDDPVSRGFHYSVVDMSLNGGLGDVTTKNVNLLPNGSEKVTAVKAADNNYWVVTHYNNKFYAYKVSASGVSTSPTVSTIGPTISDYNNIRGSLKASPDGSKIAITHTLFEPIYGGRLFLYNFNNTTGQLTLQRLLSADYVMYGIEFSSDSTKLYASGKSVIDEGEATGTIQLFQYDLDAIAIADSEYLVHEFDLDLLGDLSGALQIGIDRKIYHAVPGEYLSVIHSPNNLGSDCDFRENEVYLGELRSRYGLPPFIQSFFESVVQVDQTCLGDATAFTVNSGSDIASIDWNFGDPASGANNTSSLLEPTHVFTTEGIFEVTLEVTFTSGALQTYIEFVDIRQTPSSIGLITLEQCDNDTFLDDGISIFNLELAEAILLESYPGFQVKLFESNADAIAGINEIGDYDNYTNTVNGQILYAKVYQNIECYAINQVQLQVLSASNLGNYDTIAICETSDSDAGISIAIDDVIAYLVEDFPSGTISIHETQDDALLLQNELSGSLEVAIADIDNLFFRISDDVACQVVGSIDLDIAIKPEIFDQNFLLCSLEVSSIVLDAGAGYASYQWSTGATTQTLNIDEPGEYIITITNEAGCENEAVFTVDEIPSVAIEEIIINDFSESNSITIVPSEIGEELSYSINGGSSFVSTNSFYNLQPGIYDIVVLQEGCSEATETVIIGGLPSFFTPNSDGVNDKWQILNPGFYEGAIIELYDRYGKNLITFSAQSSWDGTYNGKLLPSSDYWYKLSLKEGRVVTGHVTLKR